MTAYRNFSFAGGEIAPAYYARPDLVQYVTGARKLRNFAVTREGAIRNRGGSKFVAEVHTSAEKARLVPFVFNNDNAFVLVFNAGTMRVMKNGGQITDLAMAISSITQANPGVVTTVAPHGLTAGDHEAAMRDIEGMTELNGRNFKITITGASTFSLQDMDGVNFDTSGLTAHVATTGTADHIFNLATPYTEAQLPFLKFAQSADVMTIVHTDHFVREIRRLSDILWTISIVEFTASIGRPTAIATVGSAGGAFAVSYIVTALDVLNEESGAGTSGEVVVTGITIPAGIVAAAGHAFLVDEKVIFEGTSGMPEVRNRTLDVIAPVNAGVDFGIGSTAGFTVEGFTMTVGRRGVNLAAVALPTTGVPITVSWAAVPGAIGYRIYRRDFTDGVFGLVGEANGTSLLDTGFTPVLTDQPPIERVPFFKAGLFPGAVAQVQQRRAFGGSDDEPERFRLSRIGSFANFYTSIPGLDSDSVTADLAGQKVSTIKHLLDVGSLVVFTTSIEWLVQGDTNGVLKPSAVNPLSQGYNGSGDRQPLVVGATALFLQNRGTKVRDLVFGENDRYSGNDLGIFASHLFDKFTLVDWDLQIIPNATVWAVRSDGTMVALTFIPEHRVLAWHTHDWTDGTVENVASIPEGNQDRVYIVVKRTIASRTSRYIEEIASRDLTVDEDQTILDSHLTFDGRKQGVATGFTMLLSGGPPWGPTDPPLTLSSSGAFFTAADVGNAIFLRGASGDEIRFKIESFTSTTIVKGRPHKDVPADLQNTLTSDWDKAVDSVGGLWHIEGENVSVFADNFAVANPNNEAHPILTVAQGIVTFTEPFSIIHVGLPFTSDLETLDVDVSQGETLLDKKKIITRLTLALEDTRGLFVGPSDPGTDTVKIQSQENVLQELRVREEEDYESAVDLLTGTADVEIFGEWNKNGRIFVRQTDPVPATILAVAPSGYIPFR